MIKVSKHFYIEAAHLLCNHEGECKNLHGHSYKLTVCVCAKKAKSDMVADFSFIKEIVQKQVISKLDHAFIYWANSTDEAEIEIARLLVKHGRKAYPLDSRPTAEKLAEHIYNLLRPFFNVDKNRLHSVSLYETQNNYAEYSEE